MPIDSDREMLKKFIKEKAPLELKPEKLGNNPKVFYYQWGNPDFRGFFILKLCFYENATVYAAFKKDDIDIQNDFMWQVAKASDEFSIELNGKTFPFSKNSFK